ncbi:hypothetical protein RSAG8_11369, partial [Rhizoctonia solani AG-8 WAC10335]
MTLHRSVPLSKVDHRFKRHLPIEGMVPYLREMGHSTICATTIRRCVDNEKKVRQYAAEDPN